MTDEVAVIDRKLDDVIVCLARIETQCESYTGEIKRQRVILNGQGDSPGLVTRMYNHEKQMRAMSQLRWWWLGICGTMGTALVLLTIDRVFWSN